MHMPLVFLREPGGQVAASDDEVVIDKPTSAAVVERSRDDLLPSSELVSAV